MKFIYKNKKTGMYLGVGDNNNYDTFDISKSELYNENTGVIFMSDVEYERIEFDEELKRNRKEKLLKINEKIRL